MHPGELLDLDVTGVAHGGVFVARHDNRVVFVPDAIPGERVRVRLTDTSKPSFWRAEALEVLDASDHRRPHVWPAADIAVAPEDRPGGAEFGHIALPHQRELKQRVLSDALTRFAGIADPVTTMAPAGATASGTDDESDDGTGWRTRVSLHVDADGRIGPYAARSHRVIPVDALPLATPAVQRAALDLAGARPGRVDLVQPADGRVRVLARPEDRRPGLPGERGRDRRARRHGARGAAPRRAAPGPQPASAGNDPARETVIERAAGREFRVDAGGFWQVHRLAADSLTGRVAAVLDGQVDPDAEHLDLYGGVGLFAATLGLLGGPSTRITTVESDPRASEHAGENLADWLGARAETARVDRYIAKLAADASSAQRARLERGVILLDPPRAGAGRAVAEQIVSLHPASVVYVACDPVALARDLATFRAGGYEPVSIDALDLFPHSHHLETVAVLSR